MGLKEKLENLMLQEERKKQLESATEEQRRKSLAEQEEKREAEFKRLEELAKRELQPMLELVNDAYLNGRGEVEEPRRVDCSLVDKSFKSFEYGVSLSLYWEDKSLELCLGDNRVVKIEGGSSSSPVEIVRMNDKNGKQKLEDSICKILAHPWACRHTTRGDPEYCSR